MRKILTIVFITVFSAGVVQAQKTSLGKKHLDWGIKSGVNLANLRMNESVMNNPGWRTGFVFGAFFRIKGNNTFSVQPEFLYSSMGGKNTNSINGESVTRLNYFSIPVLAKYKICKTWAIVAGPQFDFLIQAAEEANDRTNKVNGAYKDRSINATAGFEFWTSKIIGFCGRYIHGFTDITPENAAANTTPIRNQGVQLTVAIKL